MSYTKYTDQQVLNRVYDPASDALKIGGVYVGTPVPADDGSAVSLQVDINGNLKTTLATTIAGEDTNADRIKVELRYAYNYISTAATTVVKGSAGFIHSITVNGGTAGTIIIYDNTAGSGNIIASFDSTNALATYTLNVSASTGITVVTSAATKITVSYR